MTLKETDLLRPWIDQVRFPNGNDINLVAVQNAIQDQADMNGIPVAFKDEQLKIGGAFSKQMDDILVMYNPEHEFDYLRFAIRIKHQGRYAFMNVYNLGGSKNFGDLNTANDITDFLIKPTLGSALGAVKKITNVVRGTNSKAEEEQNYYIILRDCLENILQ